MLKRKKNFGGVIKRNRDCAICGLEFCGQGHDGWPVVLVSKMVCDDCHAMRVVPERLKAHYHTQQKNIGKYQNIHHKLRIIFNIFYYFIRPQRYRVIIKNFSFSIYILMPKILISFCKSTKFF